MTKKIIVACDSGKLDHEEIINLVRLKTILFEKSIFHPHQC